MRSTLHSARCVVCFLPIAHRERRVIIATLGELYHIDHSSMQGSARKPVAPFESCQVSSIAYHMQAEAGQVANMQPFHR